MSALIRASTIATAVIMVFTVACPARDAGRSAWTGNAKDFRFTTIDGRQHRLSDYAGEPLVVSFFTTT